MRPSNYGGAIQVTVFDDTRYIATVSADTHVAYQAEPGKHTFMVVSEAADFMNADLTAGKTYKDANASFFIECLFVNV